MSSPAAVSWVEVMRKLTGLRLAIYDELIREGALRLETLNRELVSDGHPVEQMETAIGWLEQHGFLVRDQGRWRAVSVSLARERYESGKPIERTPDQAAGSNPPVHAHQGEWFGMEGYKR